MLHLHPFAPLTPQFPRRRFGALTELAASLVLHVSLFTIVALVGATSAPRIELHRTDQDAPDVRHIVFLAREVPRIGGGGGGGGNQQPGPIRRAQGAGVDAITLRVREPAAPIQPAVPTASPAIIEEVPPLPSIVVDAKPLALGMFEQVGLPAAGALSGASTGPGAGGGVGTGSGTGTGAGRGPGLGSGSGGGTGGGAYRPGGAVTAPRLLNEVKPRYTSEAMRTKIQGTVVLEVLVSPDGCASKIRVVKSLDPGGLDEEARIAVEQWRFEPGRLAGTPVEVLVIIMLDFTIR